MYQLTLKGIIVQEWMQKKEKKEKKVSFHKSVMKQKQTKLLKTVETESVSISTLGKKDKQTVKSCCLMLSYDCWPVMFSRFIGSCT